MSCLVSPCLEVAISHLLPDLYLFFLFGQGWVWFVTFFQFGSFWVCFGSFCFRFVLVSVLFLLPGCVLLGPLVYFVFGFGFGLDLVHGLLSNFCFSHNYLVLGSILFLCFASVTSSFRCSSVLRPQ